MDRTSNPLPKSHAPPTEQRTLCPQLAILKPAHVIWTHSVVDHEGYAAVKTRYIPAPCVALSIAVISVSGCGSSGVESNFDRSEEYTEILSEVDRSNPTDLSEHIGETLQGSATYEGVAVATFARFPDSDFESFSGSADARLVADFDDESIRGRMTDWEDGDPLSHELRGEIVLSNGTFDRPGGELDGTFSARVTGNIERSPIALFDPADPPVVVLIDGVAEGAFYNSESGEIASHIVGTMADEFVDPFGNLGTMTGGFVAER